MASEEEEAAPQLGRSVSLREKSSLWKKVSTNVEKEGRKQAKPKQKDNWKDLGTMVMEERFKAEERKEIMGEEWRKISRIFDRLFGNLHIYCKGKGIQIFQVPVNNLHPKFLDSNLLVHLHLSPLPRGQRAGHGR